jgi:hypothetical protein
MVADISDKILDNGVYDGRAKELIKSYEQEPLARSDIVFCWFVIHHVLKSELNSFVRFLKRRGRTVILNTPKCFESFMSEDLGDDGLMTVERSVEDVVSAFHRSGFQLIEECEQQDDSYILVFSNNG